MESIQFLTWTSPIVAALLALTTIVFSQYNERILYNSNSLNKEIKNKYSSNSVNYEYITEKLNEMIFILKGKSIYTVNLFFFSAISYLSFFAWLLAGIGYFKGNNSGLGNSIIIIIGLTVITLTFFILPIILIIFNKKPIIALDRKNRLSFQNLSKYIKSVAATTDGEIIETIIKPSCEITLSFTNKLSLNFKQELPIYGVYFIFEFIGEDFKKQLIKLSNPTNEKYLSFKVNSIDKKANDFEGLFTQITSSLTQNLFVFSNDKTELIAVYKLKSNYDEENNLFLLTLRKKHRLASNEQVVFILDSISNFQDVVGRNVTEYIMK